MRYYSKHIGDYHKKAGRLSMLQHGAYTLLIDSCYDRERFPTTEEAIDWLWASSKEEVEAVEFVLSKFFKLQDDGTHVQARIAEELEKYRISAVVNRLVALAREGRKKNRTDFVEACNSMRDEIKNDPLAKTHAAWECLVEALVESHDLSPNHKPLTNKPLTNKPLTNKPLTNSNNNKNPSSDKSENCSPDEQNKNIPDEKPKPAPKPKPKSTKPKIPSSIPQEIFDHWVSVMGKNKQAKFTKERKAKVLARLQEGYTPEDLKLAVDGCAKSPYHMGQNEQGTVYDDLELICRNGAKLENFKSKASAIPPPEDPYLASTLEFASRGVQTQPQPEPPTQSTGNIFDLEPKDYDEV